MKKITKTYKVYNFNELEEDIQQKIIDKWYEKEDYHFLSNDIREELNYLDKHKIFNDVKLYYSLSNCQGDGLSFDSEIDLHKFLEKIYSKKLKTNQFDAICNYVYKVYTKNTNNHYCYASKTDINFNYNIYEKYKHIENLWQDILEEIKDYYLEICRKLENYGYSILDYRMDFNEFSELCENNEYNFLKNGKMVNY